MHDSNHIRNFLAQTAHSSSKTKVPSNLFTKEAFMGAKLYAARINTCSHAPECAVVDAVHEN